MWEGMGELRGCEGSGLQKAGDGKMCGGRITLEVDVGR